MLIVVSPAKTLDYESPVPTRTATTPDFLEDSRELIDQLRQLEPHQVSNLMSISAKLGELNAERFQQWQTPFNADNARQAALAFKGDVYTGLAADQFSEDDFAFAQIHMRILSGLYGLLRPLDLMQPYRLEMGTRFENKRGKDLYAFWGDKLTEALNAQLAKDDGVLINLASNEYFKAVNHKKLKGTIITPQFKDYKNGQFKIISFYAKKARGLMSAYIIRNRLTSVEDLKGFDTDGYAFNPELSKDREWVFTR